MSDHAGTHQAFENDLRAGRTAGLQLLVDGTDSNTAVIALGYAACITEQFTQEKLPLHLKRLGGLGVEDGWFWICDFGFKGKMW